MSETVSDFLTGRLIEWGTARVFGYSGDGINGVMEALQQKKESIPFVQVRHEESAAFMACAHAKFTGGTGVCIATGGPGAIHLLNGLYDAKLDHQPVVAILGQKPRYGMGSNSQQEVNLTGLFTDVAAYVETINVPEQAPLVIDRAMRISRDRRTVTAVIVPSDVQTLEMPDTIRPAHDVARSAVGYRAPRVIPHQTDLEDAAEILNAGERVGILVGAGCLGAAEEVRAVAEKLQAGVAKAMLGKAALPDDLPYVTGCLGLLGTEPSDEMMKKCDTLLMIGSTFPYTEFLPATGQAKGVQIDIDAKAQSVFYPMDVNLTGDARSTLQALLPLLEEKPPGGEWRGTIEANIEAWWKKLEKRAHEEADPINPQRLFWELSPKLPDDCILCADSGTAANWFARDLRIREGMMASLSGKLASMCPAIPYAIAAKMAYPERVPIALIGDGAMQMLGITNLITIAKYWKQWSDPRLVILVLNNHDLAQVTWEMRAMEGNPKFEASQNIPDMDYARFARDLGLEGVRIDDPGLIGETWDRALSADRPFVIDAVTDAEVPTVPPHISFDQAKNYLSSVLKGDAERLGFIRQTIRDVMPGKTDN